MNRISAFSQNLRKHWSGAMLQTGTVGAFGTAHHILLAVLCGLVALHTGFAAVCLFLGIAPLAIAKLFSVCFYLGCIIYKLRNPQSNDLIGTLIVLEVSFHALIANYFIGWDSGSSIYLMDVALVLAVITSTSLARRLATMLTLSAATIASDLYFNDYVPVLQLSEQALNTTRMINYTVALLLIAIAAMGYQYLIAIANIKMQKLANEDQLTGQLNRRAMIEKSRVLIEKCSATQTSICAAIGDLDHFKSINDTFGHAVGDEVLLAAAGVIRQYSREGDLSGRWGGEEFVWLMPNTSPDEARACLDQLRVAIEKLQPASAEHAWSASISIGITQVLPDEEFDTVVRRADRALYTAKGNGRNRIEIASPETTPQGQATTT